MILLLSFLFVIVPLAASDTNIDEEYIKNIRAKMEQLSDEVWVDWASGCAYNELRSAVLDKESEKKDDFCINQLQERGFADKRGKIDPKVIKTLKIMNIFSSE